MGDGVQHPRCPFYPESCEVERHAGMAHRWRESAVALDIARRLVAAGSVLGAKADPPTMKVAMTRQVGRMTMPVSHKESISHGVSHKASDVSHETGVERMKRWRAEHKEEYRAANRKRMARVRAEKKLVEK